MGSGIPAVEIANEAYHSRLGSAAKEVDRFNRVSGRMRILGRFVKSGRHTSVFFGFIQTAYYLEDSLIFSASSSPAAVGFTLPSKRISFADTGWL
jgi:hypothetical protein